MTAPLITVTQNNAFSFTKPPKDSLGLRYTVHQYYAREAFQKTRDSRYGYNSLCVSEIHLHNSKCSPVLDLGASAGAYVRNRSFSFFPTRKSTADYSRLFFVCGFERCLYRCFLAEHKGLGSKGCRSLELEKE